MEKSQVRETVDAMGVEDRVYLEAYLKVKNLVDSEGFRKDSAARLKSMRSGESISSSALRELNQALAEKGL